MTLSRKTGKELIDELLLLLNDAELGHESTRWGRDQLLEYANDAIPQIALIRPDVVSENTTLTLQPGSRQELPEDAFDLYRIDGVLDGNGNVISRPGESDREASIVAQTWFGALGCHNSSGPYVLTSYEFTPDDSTIFYVQPPVPPGKTVKIQANIGQLPAPFGEDDKIPIDDRFHNAMIEWALYRAFSIDQESQTNAVYAENHKEHFYEMLKLFTDQEKAVLEQ